jgi:hypothetical protein
MACGAVDDYQPVGRESSEILYLKDFLPVDMQTSGNVPMTVRLVLPHIE